VTVHSRISDLRGDGHVIEKRTNPGGTGYGRFSYRLVLTALERSLQDDDGLGSLDEHGVVAASPCSSSDAPSEALTVVGPVSQPSARTLDSASTEGPAAAYDAAGPGFIDGACAAPCLHVDECPAVDGAPSLSAAGLPFDPASDVGDLGWREGFPPESSGEALPPPSHDLQQQLRFEGVA
jgi:hypothetical protein